MSLLQETLSLYLATVALLASSLLLCCLRERRADRGDAPAKPPEPAPRKRRPIGFRR